MKIDHRKFPTLKSEIAKEANNPEFQSAYRTRRFVHEIALAVRSMREAAGLSQVQLAEMIGTKQPGIARLERSAHRVPQWHMLDRIAAALGKQMRLVFDDDGDQRPAVEVRGKRARGTVVVERRP